MCIFTYTKTMKMILFVFLHKQIIVIVTNEYMPKRITTIVGAGAVLDFDFSSWGIVPINSKYN